MPYPPLRLIDDGAEGNQSNEHREIDDYPAWVAPNPGETVGKYFPSVPLGPRSSGDPSESIIRVAATVGIAGISYGVSRLINNSERPTMVKAVVGGLGAVAIAKIASVAFRARK